MRATFLIPTARAAAAAGLVTLLSSPLASLAHAGEPTSVTVDLNNAPNGKMSLRLSTSHVPAGPVEFIVKNDSSSMKHELMIMPWTEPISALPYDKKSQQLNEDKLPALEGVEDLNPHEKVTIRLTLKEGKYLVFCNQPGHFRDDMRSTLIVSRAK